MTPPKDVGETPGSRGETVLRVTVEDMATGAREPIQHICDAAIARAEKAENQLHVCGEELFVLRAQVAQLRELVLEKQPDCISLEPCGYCWSCRALAATAPKEDGT